ncbi:hypothetical protein tinsulaeT_27800 [Thalassotalea insulae]|uniref:Lanthionine synthetase-like protein n=1 Tax=Thalassotalea insulae TaxID=2056778 RepID=A0ABQ6GU31_9GAMM|nr:lanthionine synthetase LanC family protein [Thalassotalea insulae]GLX79440.1 hypothetical protein tinsulaeT_27800 [Thalassotalea insulae]
MSNLLKRVYISAVVVSVFISQLAKAVEADDVLMLAEKTGHWLASTAVKKAQGIAWPDNVNKPELQGYDLGSGAAGKVIFFTALYQATGKSFYLTQAKQGADYLISLLAQPTYFNSNNRKASLYNGIAGIGVALMELNHVQANEKYHFALEKIVALLVNWSQVKGKQRHWSDKFNDLLYGDTGTILFLSDYANQYNAPQAQKMAQQGAYFLLSQVQKTEQGGYWFFRRDKAFNLPNFSHGTAGVVYTLATVGKQSRDKTIINGAIAGVNYLTSIAEIEQETIRFPYGWGSENWQGLYQFGWAHGLSGVALTLQQVKQSGIEVKQSEHLLKLIKHTLLNINVAGKVKVPFSEPSTPLDFRFGRAGVLSLVSHWSRESAGDKKLIKIRDELWATIARAAIQDDKSAYWLVDAPAFMGGGKAKYTGLLHGAAGVGMTLLNMHAAMVNKASYVRLPDDPYSR